jgi:TRAP-type C4-dicarboxylate transport system permease small subunit
LSLPSVQNISRGDRVRAFLNGLYRLSGGLAAASIVGICALVAAQVMLNAVDRVAALLTGEAIGMTIPSYADFTGFLLSSATFLALAYTLRMGGHIRVTLVLQNLPTRPRVAVEAWCLAAACGLSGYFAWYTAGLVRESHAFGDVSSGMVAVPLWIPQTAMLAGLIVLTIALADELQAVLRGRRPTYLDEQSAFGAREGSRRA